LRGDPLVYPQQRGGEHPYVVAQAVYVVAQAVYVVAQATYLSADAVLFGEDAFELAAEMVEVDGVGHGMIVPDRPVPIVAFPGLGMLPTASKGAPPPADPTKTGQPAGHAGNVPWCATVVDNRTSRGAGREVPIQGEQDDQR
jgi:hypothetical protein